MAGIKPRTWGSGASAPEDIADQRANLMMALLAALVVAPIVTVVAALTYQFGLVVGRLRWQILVSAGMILVVLWWLLGGSFGTYFTGHRELFWSVRDGTVKATLADEWVRWLLLQVPVAVTFGVLAGALYSTWRWARRPTWEEDDRRPYPWVAMGAKKTRTAIAADVDGPATGVTVGMDPVTGERVIQSDAEGGAHTLVTGGSGTGKSTAIKMQMRDVIRQGRGLVLIDLKGSDDMPEQIAEWCARYGRVFHHWTFQDPSVPYDGPATGLSYYEPVGRGDATRRAGMLLATREWSAEADHYKRMVEGFLQVSFNIFEKTPASGRDAIADMVSMATDPNALMARAQKLFEEHYVPPVDTSRVVTGWGEDSEPEQGTVAWIDNWSYVDDSDVASLLQSLASYVSVSSTRGVTIDETVKYFGQALNTFKQSIAGRQLTGDPKGLLDIDLNRVAREGQVVVFSLNSSNYPEPAAALGSMIIQDLKTVSAELRGDPVWFASQDPRHRLHVYIDEFGALKADNTKTLLQQVRDARISVSLSTQSISDLAYHSPEFRDALLNTVASFLAMRPNTQEESETLAGLSGGMMRTTKHTAIEQSTSIGGIDTGAATGGGMLREEMGFVIEPHTFQALRIGEAVYISSGGGARRALKVQVVQEDTGAVEMEPQGIPPQMSTRFTQRSDVSGLVLGAPAQVREGAKEYFASVPDPDRETRIPAAEEVIPVMGSPAPPTVNPSPSRTSVTSVTPTAQPAAVQPAVQPAVQAPAVDVAAPAVQAPAVGLPMGPGVAAAPASAASAAPVAVPPAVTPVAAPASAPVIAPGAPARPGSLASRPATVGGGAASPVAPPPATPGEDDWKPTSRKRTPVADSVFGPADTTGDDNFGWDN